MPPLSLKRGNGMLKTMSFSSPAPYPAATSAAVIAPADVPATLFGV